MSIRRDSLLKRYTALHSELVRKVEQALGLSATESQPHQGITTASTSSNLAATPQSGITIASTLVATPPSKVATSYNYTLAAQPVICSLSHAMSNANHLT